ncbi:MAG: type II CAAX endopeptidase family protein [Myxococcota bacterium]
MTSSQKRSIRVANRVTWVTVVTGLAAAGSVSGCAWVGSTESSPAAELIWATLSIEITIALAAWAGTLFSAVPAVTRLGLGPGRLTASDLGFLVLGGLALSFSLDVLLNLTDLHDQSVLAELNRALRGIRGGTLLLALIGLGVAPGIAEELLCRGLIQRGLTDRVGVPAAIALAAVAFGVIHLEVIHGTVAAVLGVYFGLAAHLAGSIRAAILCHTSNNLAAVMLTAAAPDVGFSPAASLALGLSVAGGCLWRVWRRRPRTAAGDGPDTDPVGLQPPRDSDDS